jgi:hypothetical protein
MRSSHARIHFVGLLILVAMISYHQYRSPRNQPAAKPNLEAGAGAPASAAADGNAEPIEEPEPNPTPSGDDESPQVAGGDSSDKQQIEADLRETREKLRKLKEMRSRLSGPNAAAIDRAIESLEASADAIETLLRKAPGSGAGTE